MPKTYNMTIYTVRVHQDWGRLQGQDYNYDYNYTMITKNDYDYDNSQRKLITIMIMITCNNEMFLKQVFDQLIVTYQNVKSVL